MRVKIAAASERSALRKVSIATVSEGETRHIIGAVRRSMSQNRRPRPGVGLFVHWTSVKSRKQPHLTSEPPALIAPVPADFIDTGAAPLSPSPGPVRGVGVVALTQEGTLLDALAQVAVGPTAVVSAPSADQFIDPIVANAGAVAFIDAVAAPEPLDAFIAQLRAQLPGLILIVAGSSHQRAALAAHIADGTVFRFLHLPSSPPRLKLLVEAALRQRAVALDPALGAAPALLTPRERSRPGLWLLWLAAASAVALAALWLTRAPQPAVLTSDVPVAQWLVQSDAILAQAGREWAASPAEPAAPQSLREQLEQLVDTELSAQAHAQLLQARARIARGELLPMDGALRYLTSAQALSNDAEVASATRDLDERLVDATRRALASGDATAVERWLQADGEAGIDLATYAELSLQATPVPATDSTQPDVRRMLGEADDVLRQFARQLRP
jgi:hypothetical protein